MTGRRANVCTTCEMTPTAGTNMMYTSGCPNTQKMCCQSSGSPPCAASKKRVSSLRSSSSIAVPTMSGVNAKTIIALVTSMAQQKSGSRLSDIPGARMRRMPTIISAAAPMAAISATLSPMSQKSMCGPGEYCLRLSGTYANQPPSGATPKRKLE